MSHKWYPVIDDEKCIECGACLCKCSHGVYDPKSLRPWVIHPENCIEGCRGCQKLCPTGAIQYVGDFTGKPSANCEESAGCCSTSPLTKTVTIDFFYLDLSVCTRCQGTESSLLSAIEEVAGVLQSAGYRVELHSEKIDSIESAIIHEFSSSPTIRVNGIDIASVTMESTCQECGDLCGDDVLCRVWSFEGITFTEPPKAMIINAILSAVYSPKRMQPSKMPFQLPMNIIKFFQSIDAKKTR